MVDAQDRGWGSPCPSGSIVNIRVGGRSFNVHRRVAAIFRAFIQELVDRGYSIDKGQLDDWSYNCRKIAGSDSWSNHAWGLAVDINSLTNPMGSRLVTDMPSWVRDSGYLMRKYGLRWGGTYTSRPDAMHFEFMLTPADADRLSKELDDVMTEAQMNRLLNRIEEAERRVARYVDHGEAETTGSSNHHARLRADIDAMGKMVADIGSIVVDIGSRLEGLGIPTTAPNSPVPSPGDIAEELARRLAS